MSQAFIEPVLEYWPVIVSVLGGLIVAILTYMLAKVKNKTKVAELEAANLELKTAIIKGSFVMCPKCGEKIYLKDVTIYTDGGKK